MEVVHAALQLPALLGRRSAPDARRRPARNRPRRARRARASSRSSRRTPCSRTPSASSRTSSSRTARRRWRRSARGSLSLMDAGVPIKAPVAGIAMGLIKEGDRFAVLTDILGSEDHLGDMDFKVAGTREGITAFQMDIKIGGITFEIMEQALARARDGRLHILDVMEQCLAEPREEISAYAPRISIMQINPDKIRRGHRTRRQGHQAHHRGDRRPDRHRGHRRDPHRRLLAGSRASGPRRSSAASSRIPRWAWCTRARCAAS